MPSSITALADARPTITPTCIVRYRPAVATALYFLSTAACVLMNVAACAIPVPNPAGRMYRDSQRFVCPRHLRNNNRYVREVQVVATSKSVLYRPDLLCS